jgi:hypothetical protein
MMKIYSHDDRFMVWQVKQYLDENNVPCFIKNEFAGGAMGELAPGDCQPEVWLADNSWQFRARVLIEQLAFNESVGENEWFCPRCHEPNASSFELCWQCGCDPEQSP